MFIKAQSGTDSDEGEEVCVCVDAARTHTHRQSHDFLFSDPPGRTSSV